jgi:hypothetical protein
VKLRNLLRGAPSASEAPPRRRRRTPRPGGPRTIIPIDDAQAPTPQPGTPFALKIDEARSRLRQAIPPADDDLL